MATVTDAGTIGLKGWYGTSRGMPTAHRHFDLELNYVLHGAMTYLIGGAVVTLPPRRLCALWGGMAHQTLHEPENPSTFWVTVPMQTALAWGIPDALMRHLLRSGLAVDSRDLHDEQLLQRWVEDLTDSTEEKRRIVLLEIEARLRRLAMHFESADPAGPPSSDGKGMGVGLAAVATLARHICDHYHEEVSIEQIAAAAHLHPGYAMTLFRQHTGMTLNGYLTMQRVAHAQRLLSTTERAVSDIARDSGFGSASRFYEAFRDQTGTTPRAFRQSAQQRCT